MNKNYFNSKESDVGESNGTPASFSAKDNPNQKSNTVEIPTINLPKGGGAIKGIEEKFQVNSVTGTASIGIPIPLSPSRHGFVPAVGLNYDSGSGNSPFGIGWSLGIPRIARKNGKHLPQYKDEEESDTFILSDAEDLVPLLENDGGNWNPYKKQKTENGVSFTVSRYRPRIEGLFVVIEKWKNNQNGETHWRTVTRDNVHSYFGISTGGRLSDFQDETKISEWNLCRTHDDKGNICFVSSRKKRLNFAMKFVRSAKNF